MPTLEPEDGKCGARVKQIPDDWPENDDGEKKDAYCANPSGFRTDNDDGKCYLHGGCSVGVPDNTHAMKHGMYADRQRYYDNCSYEEQVWIDSIVESMLDDASFGPEAKYKLEMVRNIAIDMHKLQNANDYIDEVGLVHRDKTVGYTDDGKPIKMDEENVINIAYDRLDKNITRKLDKLGLLDSPEQQQADNISNIATEMAAMRQELAKEDNEN